LRVSPKRLKLIRVTAWASLLALTLSCLGLSFLSAGNYTDVALAKLSVDIGADISWKAAGLGASGEVLVGSVFSFNATINVSNPSHRTVRLQYMMCQGWIEDYIKEDLVAGNFTYGPVFAPSQSFPANSGSISPESTVSFNLNWTLSRPEQLVYFDGARQILNYVLLNSTRHLHWNQASWNCIFVFRLIVADVPTDFFGPNSEYLAQLPLITRTQVISLGG